MPYVDRTHSNWGATSFSRTIRRPWGRVIISSVKRLRKLILAAWLGAGLLAPLPLFAHHLKVGEPAPPLVLHTLDGKSISTSDLKGQVVVVTFWATWCEPCREELPLLSAYAAEHKADGLAILGFSLDDADNLEAVKKVAATLSFPTGLLGSPWAGGYGRVWRIPVSFVIDRNGNLVEDGWGEAEPAFTRARLEREITPLLAR